MRILPAILAIALLLPSTSWSAEETLYLRTQPSIPLLSSTAADATVLRRLAPGEAARVLGRQAGFVNVDVAGARGWLRETDLTAIPPPGVRVAELEGQVDKLGSELAASQAALRAAEAEARQARATASAARNAGADEAAGLAEERDALQQALSTSQAELAALRTQLAELEMAQDAQRLLAQQQPTTAPGAKTRFSLNELALGAAIGLLLAVFGAWLGTANARRRLRRRYHGLEL